MKRKKINYQLLLRRVCLIVLDIVLIIISSLMALLTRFEFDIEQIPEEFLDVLVSYGILMIFVTLSVFAVFRIYSSLWEYAGLEETFKIIGAVVVSSLCDMAIVVGFGKHLPRSYYVIRTFYLIALVGGSRFFYRLLRLRYRKRQHYSIKKKKKIMLIGAGEAGRTLIQEIQNSRYLDQKICCVIDDNRRKIGRYILGIRVVGDRNAIKRSVEHYGIEQIIIAIPSAGSRKIRPILEICKDTGCELKILPGVYQLVNGEVNVSKLRPVNIEDLLGREEINVNIDEIMDYVCSKTILVTGGGGSIGSELCRQIAAHKPERLIIFDIYENNAYDIQQELKMKYPNLKLTVLIFLCLYVISRYNTLHQQAHVVRLICCSLFHNPECIIKSVLINIDRMSDVNQLIWGLCHSFFIHEKFFIKLFAWAKAGKFDRNILFRDIP